MKTSGQAYHQDHCFYADSVFFWNIWNMLKAVMSPDLCRNQNSIHWTCLIVKYLVWLRKRTCFVGYIRTCTDSIPIFLIALLNPYFPWWTFCSWTPFLIISHKFTCLIPKKTQFWSRNLHSNGKLLVFLCFSVDTALPPARAAAPPAPVVSDARVPAVQWCPLAWTPRKGGFGNKLGLKHTVFQQKSGFKHRTFWRFNRLVVV